MCQCGTCASCDRSTLYFAREAYQFDNLHWIQLLEKERYLWSQAELYFDSWTIVYCVEMIHLVKPSRALFWLLNYCVLCGDRHFNLWIYMFCHLDSEVVNFKKYSCKIIQDLMNSMFLERHWETVKRNIKMYTIL